MFLDWTLPDDMRGEGTIPPSRFEVPLKMSKTLSFCVAMSVICLIGTLVALDSRFATPTFWIGYSAAGLSSALIIVAIRRHLQQKREIQAIFFHKAPDLDTYKVLLQKEQALLAEQKLYFSINLPYFIERHLEENKRLKANLRNASYYDTSRRNEYQFHGVGLPSHAIKKRFGEELYVKGKPYLLGENFITIYDIANQSLISEILGILMSRYNNQSLHVSVHQRNCSDEKANTRYNLVSEKRDPILYVTQLFRISCICNKEEILCYIKATMRIDLHTGRAIIYWKGTQNEMPELDD